MTGRYDEGLAMMAATVDNWEVSDNRENPRRDPFSTQLYYLPLLCVCGSVHTNVCARVCMRNIVYISTMHVIFRDVLFSPT